jgi:hypothetical protein
MSQDLTKTKMQSLNNKGTLQDGRIRKDDRVSVVGTGFSRHIKKGEEIEVHPVHAQTLIKSGKAKAA